jgi:hypothetical protein
VFVLLCLPCIVRRVVTITTVFSGAFTTDFNQNLASYHFGKAASVMRYLRRMVMQSRVALRTVCSSRALFVVVSVRRRLECLCTFMWDRIADSLYGAFLCAFQLFTADDWPRVMSGKKLAQCK